MTRAEFFAALCGRFSWTPTAWRLAVFDNWATQEGMPEYVDLRFRYASPAQPLPTLLLNSAGVTPTSCLKRRAK